MAVLKGSISNDREVHKANSIISGVIKVKVKLPLRLMKLETNTSLLALVLMMEVKLFYLLLKITH